MGAFELIVAARGSSDEDRVSLAGSTPWTTVVVVHGRLENSALEQLHAVILEQCDEGAASLIVELERVEASSATFSRLAEMLMSLRASGIDVQALARDAELTRDLRAYKDSRDWLVASGCDDEPGARRALHLDGPRLDQG